MRTGRKKIDGEAGAVPSAKTRSNLGESTICPKITPHGGAARGLAEFKNHVPAYARARFVPKLCLTRAPRAASPRPDRPRRPATVAATARDEWESVFVTSAVALRTGESPQPFDPWHCDGLCRRRFSRRIRLAVDLTTTVADASRP